MNTKGNKQRYLAKRASLRPYRYYNSNYQNISYPANKLIKNKKRNTLKFKDLEQNDVNILKSKLNEEDLEIYIALESLIEKD